jgi:hypothetical protein
MTRPGACTMQRLFLAFIVVLILPTLVVAQQAGQQPTKPKSSTPRPGKSNPCAQYGAGFVQVGDTTTCIKIGAGVTFEGGGGAGTR